MKNPKEMEAPYRFVYFDHKPGVWLVIIAGLLLALLVIFVFVVLIALFRDISNPLFMFVFSSLIFVPPLLLSRFKYRRRGILQIDEEGITVEPIAGKSERFTWNDIRGLNVRIVDHFMVRSLNRAGGYLRYHQIGSNDRSISLIDMIGFNGREFLLFIRNRAEFKRLGAAISLLKQNAPLSYDEETYNFGDSIR